MDAMLSLSDNLAISDPFARGIQFNAKFVNSVEVKSLRDNEEVRKRVAEKIRTSDPSLNTNAVFVVKSNTLRVKNLTQNSTVDYLISRIVYCGAHTEFKDRFFFIHRSKHDRTLFAEIYWLSSAEKVKALTLTIAKAFQISYRGWIADMMMNREDEIPSDSSNSDNNIKLRVRSVPPGVLTKRSITPGRSSDICRRHSFGDECEPPTGSPAVYKVQAKNELTGSTHDVTLTVDMNIEFRELAESRSSPDILSTDLPSHELSHFDLNLVQEYMDN